MENQLSQFTPMNEAMLLEINGGGFAYDVGRALRFLLLMGPSGTNTAIATCDWIINDVANEAANS